LPNDNHVDAGGRMGEGDFVAIGAVLDAELFVYRL